MKGLTYAAETNELLQNKCERQEETTKRILPAIDQELEKHLFNK